MAVPYGLGLYFNECFCNLFLQKAYRTEGYIGLAIKIFNIFVFLSVYLFPPC